MHARHEELSLSLIAREKEREKEKEENEKAIIVLREERDDLKRMLQVHQ